ncbi:SCO family protein [Phenylobacterium sp.]|jgi:protein SCO1/2|uniref:SCO family protein n=1 Tax=Phenylobacterium sp. TaxID=1871053 RepID=UPI002E358B1D|nr:SCO family protein [Phenylobacterium sp.]HEX3363670.1 SCO family protein [Phenylobacterium sp.]
MLKSKKAAGARSKDSGLELLLAAALVLGLLGAAGYLFLSHPPKGVSPTANIGGPFDLVDQTGRRVTNRDLRGKPSLVAFGFTTCPDVCPTTLTHMTNWLRALGPAGDRLNVVYVTVDPERDTPKQLGAYLAAFDPRIRGLTGSPANIALIAHEYRVYYQKVPLAGGGYTMDHSAILYLMDAKGRFVRPLGYDQPDEVVLPSLRRLLNG